MISVYVLHFPPHRFGPSFSGPAFPSSWIFSRLASISIVEEFLRVSLSERVKCDWARVEISYVSIDIKMTFIDLERILFHNVDSLALPVDAIP